MKYDPHGRAERLHVMMERMRDGSAGLSKENVETFCRFHRDMLAESMGIVRLYKYLEVLRRLARRTKKPLIKLSKNEIKEFVISIESDPKLSDWSKHDFKLTLKKLFKWHKGNNKEYPAEVSWISTRVRDKHKLPEELLTEDEIKRMIEASHDPRDRAFVQILYESGCRISEVLTLQLKNIKFDEYGAVIVVTGKTGARRMRLIASVPALAAWIELHPFKDRSDAYLFIRRKFGKEENPIPFRYEYAARIIKNLAKEVGITKRVHPHLFRHSRATSLASKLTEAQMKEYFGWVQASNMASIYVHMSGRDVDDAILKMYGVKKEDGGDSETFKPILCARCGSSSPPASKICSTCGLGFRPEEEKTVERPKATVISQLMQDDEFKELMMRKIVEMNL
jgi:integrase/ribosomal protein L37E